jgi:hypothetical protein
MADGDKEKKSLEVLTCSAADYAKNKGAELTAYRMIGINSQEVAIDLFGFNGEGYVHKVNYKNFKDFAIKMGCEAVVDFKQIHYPDYHAFVYFGTGMIREKADDKQGD